MSARRARVVLGVGFLGSASCANPISNELFLEDAVFLSALPSDARFGPPEAIRGAPVGTSRVLQAASIAAAELDDLDLSVRASGEALRATQPAARTETERSWDAASTAVQLAGEAHLWWVRGSVVRPVRDGGLAWTVEASPDGEGGWVPVGAGVHDPDGSGQVDWDLDAQSELLGLDERPGSLAIDYDDAGFDGDRRLVEAELVGPLSLGRTWAVGAEEVLVWTGFFALTTDGMAWPGAAQVLHGKAGGFGVGALFVDGAELPFESCWTAAGEERYLGGHADIDAAGDTAACPFPNPFADDLADLRPP